MKIVLIIVRSEHNSDVKWIEAAFDEYLLDANASPYFDAVKIAAEKYGNDNVRELEVVIPDGSLDRAFPPLPQLQGTVVKAGKTEQEG